MILKCWNACVYIYIYKGKGIRDKWGLLGLATKVGEGEYNNGKMGYAEKLLSGVKEIFV